MCCKIGRRHLHGPSQSDRKSNKENGYLHNSSQFMYTVNKLTVNQMMYPATTTPILWIRSPITWMKAARTLIFRSSACLLLFLLLFCLVTTAAFVPSSTLPSRVLLMLVGSCLDKGSACTVTFQSEHHFCNYTRLTTTHKQLYLQINKHICLLICDFEVSAVARNHMTKSTIPYATWRTARTMQHRLKTTTVYSNILGVTPDTWT